MSSRTGSLSRGDVSLRKLRSKKNHFARESNKWMLLNNSIMTVEDSAENERFATPRNRFADIIGAILQPKLRTDLERVANTFASETDSSREDIVSLMERLMPYWLREQLQPLNSSELPSDPIELLKLMPGDKVKDEDALIDRRTFEAMRALELSGDYFFLTTQLNNRWNHKLPVAEGERRVTDFVAWLNPKAVLEPKKVFIFLDRRNEYRCSGISLEGSPEPRGPHLKRLVQTVYLLTMDALFKGKIQAIMQARQKDYLSAFARRFREPQAELFESVPDMYGIRFAYLEKAMLNNGVAYLTSRASLIQSDGAVKRVPIKNRHSHKKLCIKSQYLYLDGCRREVQHMPARNLYSIEYSTGPENHDLYNLRWFTDPERPGLFYHLFPPEIYGIDWSDLDIRKEMETHIKEQTYRKIERDQT